MEDKKVKKRLSKIPDVDKNGDPIYKIDDTKSKPNREKSNKSGRK